MKNYVWKLLQIFAFERNFESSEQNFSKAIQTEFEEFYFKKFFKNMCLNKILKMFKLNYVKSNFKRNLKKVSKKLCSNEILKKLSEAYFEKFDFDQNCENLWISSWLPVSFFLTKNSNEWSKRSKIMILVNSWLKSEIMTK